MAKKILIGLALFFTITASVIAILSIGYNEVIPGEIYRFRQLSGEGFSDKIDRLGIHTLVNLRGEHPHEKWYQDEVQAAKSKSVALFSFAISAKKLPRRKTLQGLIDVIAFCLIVRLVNGFWDGNSSLRHEITRSVLFVNL